MRTSQTTAASILSPACFLLCVAWLSSCASYSTIDGFEVERARYDDAVLKVKTRAAFELSCPRDDLEVTILDAANDHAIRQMGVTGCSKKVVYVYVPYSGWVMNTEADEKAGEAAVETK